MLSQIHSDLTDLYDADNYINNEILSTCNYYESEKERLTGLLNKLQNELDNIITIIDRPQITSDINDNFTNFNKVDFVGNGNRNIPKTISYIDLKMGAVSSDTVFVNKVNLREANIICKVLTDNIRTEALSDIKMCIGDNSNESWIQTVTTSSNEVLTYSVGLTLKEEVEVNTISYIASSPRKQNITLNLFDKDGNTFTYNTVTTVEKAEWNFSTVSFIGAAF